MRIRFSEIAPLGSRYEFEEINGLEDSPDFAVQGPVEGRCTLKRKGDDQVALQGWLKVTVTLACDRCLARYVLNLESDMQLLLSTDDNSWRVRDVEQQGDPLDIVILEEPVVDLDELFRQQVYLMLPVKRLCSEACLGVCPGCGVALNQQRCQCTPDDGANPFAVLKQLKQFTTIKK